MCPGIGVTAEGEHVFIVGEQELVPLQQEIHQIVGGRGELDYGAFKQAKEGALSICPDISRLKELTAGRWRERYTFRQGIEAIIRRSLSEQEP